MKKTICTLILALSLPSLLFAMDSSLTPTGVLRYEKDKVSEGYILTYPNTPGSTYAFLMDLEGNYVKKWKTNFPRGSFALFHPDGYLVTNGRLANDQVPVIFGGWGGVFEAFDWEGNKLWDYYHVSKDEIQHHGYTITPSGTIMFPIWQRFSYADMLKAGRDPKAVPTAPIISKSVFGEKEVSDFWVDGIVEWDPKTRKEVWRWSVSDHLGTGADKIDPNYYLPLINDKLNANMHLDWLHANAVSVIPEKDVILLNLRHLQSFIAIDKKTGKIVDRWGNPSSYGEGKKAGFRDRGDTKVFEPHDINYIGNNKALYFNNGFGDPLSGGSSVLIVDLETGKVDWEYRAKHASSFYSSRQSGTQMLPNGNVQITSTESGRIFEVTPEKHIVWEYIDPVVQILEDGSSETICTFQDDTDQYNGAFHRAFRYSVEDTAILKGKDLSQKVKISPNCPDFYKLYNNGQYIAN